MFEDVTHVALGAATALTTPYLFAPYALYQYNNGALDNCSTWKQGIEYGLGYFGVLLFYQTYTNLQY